MKIKCSHCGLEKEVFWSSGGVICISKDETIDAYGNHNCLDGEMGTFVKKEIKDV